MKEFIHESVLLQECLEGLNIRPDGVYVDCTLGGGGHSSRIAERLSEGGRLIGIDRDEDALRAAGERLAPWADRFTPVKSNFSDVKNVLTDLELRADGILFDLGVSSFQLDEPERGFSYMQDAPLDMRMDRSGGMTAADLVNTYDEFAIADILWRYGEERYSRQIARAITKARIEMPIRTTGRLCEVIKSAMPPQALREKQHPAKRSFQALRIAVNGELSAVEEALTDLWKHLNPGGRICVITFHSLEDRITKEIFADMAKGCTCPPQFPVCVCGGKPKVKLISKKPILPTAEELERNPRARSAKLRVCEVLEQEE
ncbi:MAG: 16S rRNA (cytosine(1402)-N(4))-methyltransferase RsmH [Clostridia bacterium]|nr:16S rRNA (cytosine(1402)-N(4))-methyltransferase RsmH [Clostridia bacterium]